MIRSDRESAVNISTIAIAPSRMYDYYLSNVNDKVTRMFADLGFTDGLTLEIGSATIKLTALAIAAIAGILLNLILPGNEYSFDA